MTEPRDPNQLLTVDGFLREKGLTDEQIEDIRDEFEERVRRLYVEAYGHEPATILVDQDGKPVDPAVLDQVTFVVTEDDGTPIGMVDMDQVHTEGTRFAFALAACCDSPAQMDRLQAETLTRIGAKAFGYTAAAALRVLAEHVLSPALNVATAAGHDLRPGIRAIARGEEPPQ